MGLSGVFSLQYVWDDHGNWVGKSENSELCHKWHSSKCDLYALQINQENENINSLHAPHDLNVWYMCWWVQNPNSLELPRIVWRVPSSEY